MGESHCNSDLNLGRESGHSLRARLLRCAIAVLALFLPAVLAHANSITFDDKRGSPRFNSHDDVLSLVSAISEVDNSPAIGYRLSFSTSRLFSGTLDCTTKGEECGSWGAGGKFSITERGVKGYIFSGAFSGAVSLTSDGCEGSGRKETCEYTLIGKIEGTYSPDGKKGRSYADVPGSVQILFSTRGPYTGAGVISKDTSGVTDLSIVPEPGSLALLATGLLGTGFAVRRKISVGSFRTRG
jgi:hypothetical protein